MRHMGNRHWTEEEDLLVLRCAGRAAGAVLAQRIGRSPLAVTQRAALLRHGRTARQRHVDQPRQGRDWTRAERERLRALAGRLGPETVATLLGRTPTAVRLQAKRLGLHW